MEGKSFGLEGHKRSQWWEVFLHFVHCILFSISQIFHLSTFIFAFLTLVTGALQAITVDKLAEYHSANRETDNHVDLRPIYSHQLTELLTVEGHIQAMFKLHGAWLFKK